MLSVEAPTAFVLTLQSVPPFLVESILALALVILLAVPLIAHVQLLLDNTSKSSTMGVTNRRKVDHENRQDHVTRTVVMHYPAQVTLHKTSNSDLNVELTSMRVTCSTPTLKRSCENLKTKISNENLSSNCDDIEQQKEILRRMILTKQKTCLPLKRSSSFVATNAELPIIDISAFDYDSYRHKLIESSLKRQYGDRQAPGNVVLNSIHLNSIGSQTGLELSERYSHSLFDFIEEYYDATKPISQKEKEYLHPLDHFLIKNVERPKTADRGTETKESNTELDQVPELIRFRDQSPISTNVSTRHHERRRAAEDSTTNPSKITIRSRRSSSLQRTSSKNSITAKANVTTGQKTSPDSMTQQLFERLENLKTNSTEISKVALAPKDKSPELGKSESVGPPSPRISRSRTPRSFDNKVPQTAKPHEVVSKRAPLSAKHKLTSEFARNAIKPGEYHEVTTTDHDEGESAICASASSSEAESSCSSKPREKYFVRSRASSLSARARSAGRTPSQTRQWYTGVNTNPSFNRNYPEIQKETPIKVTRPKVITRPRSTDGRFDWDVPDVPGHNWSNRILHPDSRTSVLRPKTVTPTSSRRKSPEKDKLSDTGLPVLESVIDLRVDAQWEDPNDFDIENEVETRSVIPKRTSSPGHRISQRLTRTKDKKISIGSFAKNSTTTQPPVIDAISEPSKDNNCEPKKHCVESLSKVVGKSSGAKRPTNRPLSASRLPVHVGTERAMLKKTLQDSNPTEKLDSRVKLLEKLPRQEENNCASLSDRTRRPKTAGGARSHASSLSPKIELSLEALQTKESFNNVIKTETKTLPVQKQMAKGTSGQESKIPSRSSSLGSKKVNKVSLPSANRMAQSTSENDADRSRKSVDRENIEKKSFLRARSGKYGASKLSANERLTRRKITVDPSTTKEALENNEELEEMERLKLPTEGSKAALVMRRGLKTYIKKIKLILSSRDKTLQAKDLESLSITEAIIPELRAFLNAQEIQELQNLLDHVEKQP